MDKREFLRKNFNNGISSQSIIDAGLNVFGLQLLIESYVEALGEKEFPLEFTYRGVNVRLEIKDGACHG